ncbi:putative periplasmic serine endoprotease DegP-like precursor [Gimesia alba]|uniref:Putative periplasmic serine endoprotease DegP-like n=1 Tax=Gimesia alba TaxID=2527973 RepID=A0A517RFT2_9PLAN|nr:transglutaminase family protein [Gimesia alba]QDT42705.1 putative periplasmic serine endoprotease DegP-like precursor [Gimesia alba]
MVKPQNQFVQYERWYRVSIWSGLFVLCLIPITLAAETDSDQPIAAKRPVVNQPDSNHILTVEELAEKAKESVASVSFAGRDGQQAGLGTGFVISADGLIATNLHVIGEARPITVQLSDGEKYDVKEVYATDRQMDLAVLRIDAKDLTPLPLAEPETLKQGADIVVLGNPQGLRYSVVKGVNSGTREIDGKPMIQLAIPIEPGNSGGPVLDSLGRVQGIVTLKSAVTRNLGYAVNISALKQLLEKPNPVPINRWLTIGTLDERLWKPLFGSRWRQRAGRIMVDGFGSGLGSRSLCVSQEALPELPYEIAVEVKLDDESGAAGLIFYSDENTKHYGFYPSNKSLRISRFDGPDVFLWRVLEEKKSNSYRDGEWNQLKVRLEAERIVCYVNDDQVFEVKDQRYTQGKVGLAKFRNTVASFRGFQVASEIAPYRPSKETAQKILDLTEDLRVDRPPKEELIEEVVKETDQKRAQQALQERARLLKKQAERLQQLAQSIHERAVRDELRALFTDKKEADIDLLSAALLVARLDNSEVELKAYLNQVSSMVNEIQKTLPADANAKAKLKALNQYLFHETGFHGSRTNYYSRSNSYINETIEDREGLPITLAILYMELGRRLGLDIEGVGLPGHFVVRVNSTAEKGELVDVFESGAILSDEAAKVMIVSANSGQFDESFLEAQPKREIIKRMLRNLLNLARDSEDVQSMLRYVETMIAIDDELLQERWLRAVLRYQTGRITEAMADADYLLEKSPEGFDLRRIHEFRNYLETVKQSE